MFFILNNSQDFCSYPDNDVAPLILIRHADARVQAETMGTSMSAEGLSYKSPDEQIRAKEDAFFQELDLGKREVTHPLLHMVASQRKFDNIGASMHQVASTSKPCKLDTKRSPYEQPQVLVELKGRASTSERNSHTSGSTIRDTMTPRKHVRNIKDGDVRLSPSARRHRQFLSKTLSALHEQLEPNKLAEVSVPDQMNE